MWMMLQKDEPEDFVIATGETHSVREFCQAAFAKMGLNYDEHVVVDKQFFRPAEVEMLTGDSAKARRVLGWHPGRSFATIVEEMVESDVQLLRERG